MFESGVKNQLFSTLYGNLLSLTYGAAIGWPSASLLLLQSDLSPLESGPISLEEASWIGSMLCVGGFVGNLLYYWISDYGRKIPLISIAFPQIIGWLFVILATNPIYLYISRFFLGFSGGAIFVIMPLYVAEISENKVRGFLGSLLVFSCNVGVLMSFTLGNYLRYDLSPKVLIALPLVFLIRFIFIPETPQFLIKKQKEQEAEKSLRFYRNIRSKSIVKLESLRTEMDKLKNDYQTESDDTQLAPLKLSDFTHTAARKALLIGAVLVILNQLCGIFAMLNYTASFFAEAGSNLSPNMSAIVIGVIQLAGSYVATILVERAGRKILIGWSAIGTGVGLICIGTYSLLKSYDYDLSSFGWVSLVCFSFSIFTASWGVLTLPFLVIAEIMPEKIRSFGTSFSMSILWIFAFLSVKYYPIMSVAFGMHGCMFIFAVFSFSGAMFVFIVMPETKGKSFEAIMQSLQNN